MSNKSPGDIASITKDAARGDSGGQTTRCCRNSERSWIFKIVRERSNGGTILCIVAAIGF
jgi:hypothetical protein